MPIIALALLFLALIVAGILLIPLSLVQRYRVGTRRQQARGWLIAVNLVGIGLSSAMFLAGSALSTIWIPNAFRYSALGLLVGCAIGILGLALTRWEPSPRALHYTPNRLLVLAITLTITGRILYSFWRAWETWGGSRQPGGLARDLGCRRGARRRRCCPRLLPDVLVWRTAPIQAPRAPRPSNSGVICGDSKTTNSELRTKNQGSEFGVRSS